MNSVDTKNGSDDINMKTHTDCESGEKSSSFSAAWTARIQQVHLPITKTLVYITRRSVTNPKLTYYGCIFLAIGILVLGLMTNFRFEVDDIWTPMGSMPAQHQKYIENDAGFRVVPRLMSFTFHNEGENILGQRSAELVFEAIQAVRSLPGYDSICAAHETGECEIRGFTRFWNNSYDYFQETVTSDDHAIMAMSALVFGDGTPLNARDGIYGIPILGEDGNLTSVAAYYLTIALPETDEALDFEEDAIDVLMKMRDAWKNNPTIPLQLELFAERSFDDESVRAVREDLLLVPFVFIAMSFFTCAIFMKANKVQSRSLLGLGAVISVFLSILTGFGFMFILGVPFTSMTQILPFVLFGIGLDDAFILSGSYNRTDRKKTIEERIAETIEDIGISIVVTTITSVLAFGFGALSKVPAIHWLCIYASFTIACVLFYQLTFFVAAIALDERRIKENRRDCCTHLTVAFEDQTSPVVPEAQGHESSKDGLIDRLMLSLARLLLQPAVKVAVIVSFLGLAGFCAYSVSKHEQKFDFTDILPSDSYILDWFDATEEYAARKLPIGIDIIFRYVDQSEPDIQDQMESFVNELTNIRAITSGPSEFWVWDFKEFAENKTNMTFNEQLDQFLDNEIYSIMYGDQIVRDESGNITVSRCRMYMDNLDWVDVKDQMNALKDQRSVAAAQPVNAGRSDDFAFFTYDDRYNIWQFYANAVEEIIYTTLFGVIAVTVVAFVLVPHWTAAAFVLPLICVLYIDLLGFLQWFGINIDVVVYVSLVMSIGLLVDFIMHTLLRYYEASGTREEKVVDMLTTMGASILIGGISTFLGAVPLAFSASALFFTICIAFFGMVLLGSAHGLILLPVLLSIFGPEDEQKTSVAEAKTALNGSKDFTKIPVDISEEEKDRPAMDTNPSPSALVLMSAVKAEDQEATSVDVEGKTSPNVHKQEPMIAVDNSEDDDDYI